MLSLCSSFRWFHCLFVRLSVRRQRLRMIIHFDRGALMLAVADGTPRRFAVFCRQRHSGSRQLLNDRTLMGRNAYRHSHRCRLRGG